jgi:hypothetical protein
MKRPRFSDQQLLCSRSRAPGGDLAHKGVRSAVCMAAHLYGGEADLAGLSYRLAERKAG